MSTPYDPGHGTAGQPSSPPIWEPTGEPGRYTRDLPPMTEPGMYRVTDQGAERIPPPPSYLPPPQAPPFPDPGGPDVPKRRSWFARHKVLTVVLAVAALFVVIAGISSATAGPQPIAAAPAAPASSVQPLSPAPKTTADVSTSAPTKVAPKPPPAQPELTTSQRQAIGSAESYLSFEAFSRKGLIEQLSSSAGEGFSVADATFAVDHVKVDWKEQAVRSAKAYLEFTHFSRAGLIQQLSSAAGEGFTRAQAVYAADKVGL